ncbi:MAG: orotidine 5'-phosphate decarboxylase / HUMPS family protein [Candidatus Micrarchaeota archaeon]
MKKDRSLIIACDVDLQKYEELLKATADVDAVGGYKVGFYLGLKYGLPRIVEIARKYTDKVIMYDHQKAATDIPDTGEMFAEACADAGLDAIILFPQAGPETEKAWIDACVKRKLGVIVGGLMTHKAYRKSDGGFLDDAGIYRMYEIAAEKGIKDFVVPGNKPDEIKKIRDLLLKKKVDPVFYAPGFVAQGGSISDAAKTAGSKWHAIVGRGIYEAKDMRKAAEELGKNL